MHAATLPPLPAATVPALRALVWYREGLRLWARAPIALLLLSIVPFAVELALQLIPVVGVVLSKLVCPIVQAGLWVGLAGVIHGRPLRAACLTEGLHRGRIRTLAVLGVCLLVIPAVQVLVAALVFGPGAIGIVLLGQPRPDPSGLGFVLVLLLSGVLPATWLMLSMPFVLFDRLGAVRAVSRSLAFARAAPGAFALFALGSAGLLVLVVLGRGLPLLLLAPWMLAANLSAYRDLRAG